MFNRMGMVAMAAFVVLVVIIAVIVQNKQPAPAEKPAIAESSEPDLGGAGEFDGLLFSTVWSQWFTDVFQWGPPAASRELWPSAVLESAGQQRLASSMDYGIRRFHMFCLRRPATIKEVMTIATGAGWLVADPFQVRQFLEVTAQAEDRWPIEDRQPMVAVSREFRYFIPSPSPVVCFSIVGNGKLAWKEEDNSMPVPSGTWILMCE